MKSVEEWALFDYSVLSGGSMNLYCDSVASLIIGLYDFNRRTRSLDHKSVDSNLGGMCLGIINKAIGKLRESNGVRSSPFERKSSFLKGASSKSYKETLFFLEYPAAVMGGRDSYQRSHIVEYNILSSLNRSAEYGLNSLYSLTLLLWLLETTCCYCASKTLSFEGKVYTGNGDIALKKSFYEPAGIGNVNIYMKSKNGTSNLLSQQQFYSFRKDMFDIKEILVDAINSNKNSTDIIFCNYSHVFRNIRLASRLPMNKEMLSSIMDRVINLIV